LSTTSGSGNASITISAAANPNTNTRVANITISADNVPTVYIVVTQDAAVAALGVSSTTLSVSADENSTQMFDIKSNIAWSAQSDQEWLSLSTTSGSGNASITISAATNPNTNTRVANITISADNVPTVYIVVTQDAAVAALGVSSTTLWIAAEDNSTEYNQRLWQCKHYNQRRCQPQYQYPSCKYYHYWRQCAYFNYSGNSVWRCTYSGCAEYQSIYSRRK